MDDPELDEVQQQGQHVQPVPPAQVSATPSRRSRLRSFIAPQSNHNNGADADMTTLNSDNNHAHNYSSPHTDSQGPASTQSRSSILNMQLPALLRRFTSRRSATTARHTQPDGIPAASSTEQTRPRRSRPFASLTRSATQRFSYIHQEIITTISDRRDRDRDRDQNLESGPIVAYAALQQDDDESRRAHGNEYEHEQDQERVQEEAHEGEGDALPRATSRRARRSRLSLQMSNFFTNVTSPGNRHAPEPEPQPQLRSRLSAHEPLADLDELFMRPPTPAEVRMHLSQDSMGDDEESEYEHGFTPRRRRLRPQPVVGEPHDEDYVRRRHEVNRRTRRATWGPTNQYTLRESSMESLEAAAGPPSDLPAASTSNLSHEPRPLLPPIARPPSLLSRAFSSSPDPDRQDHGFLPASLPLMIPPPQSRQPHGPTSSPNMLRPAHLLRSMLTRRRNSHTSDAPPSNTIPLPELQRLLAAHASQSSDRHYNGHQEATVDGGTITIYGIRRLNARTSTDGDDGDLFPPPSPSETISEERPPLSRDRPRGPRRIFNFIGPGLSEIDPLLPEFETFERLRRTRRPRSMFGSGSLRRNGVVEPDVPNTAEPSSQTNGESSQSPDGDETWIFFIVSAVLPEGHPLLSAPSLFTDNPTYEDMLFLDSFLHKPVASQTDLANARGLYRIHRRSNGDLYAGSQDEVEDVIAITTERCQICLSDYEENDETRRLVKCTHFFHRECIDHWLMEGRNSCPLCRGEGVEKKRSESRMNEAGPSSASANLSPNVL